MATHDGAYIIAPRHLIIPVISGAALLQPSAAGSMFISGAKLYFHNGTTNVLITSA